MRKSVLAIAAAASIFALTSAGAAAIYNNETAKIVNLPALAKQDITMNQCGAATVEFVFTTETTESSADYGKTKQIDVVAKTATAATPAAGQLASCDTATVTVGNNSVTVTFAAESLVDDGANDYYTRTATVTADSSGAAPAALLPSNAITAIKAIINNS